MQFLLFSINFEALDFASRGRDSGRHPLGILVHVVLRRQNANHVIHRQAPADAEFRYLRFDRASIGVGVYSLG